LGRSALLHPTSEIDPRDVRMGATKPAALRGVAPGASLRALRQAAAACTACDLYRNATQTVFGRGAVTAPVVLVGEQPGHEEDIAGEPFVGPAGRLLHRALTAAGLDRSTVYLTNIVKHFKWEPRGKRRIHAKPTAREISACQPWFRAEMARIRPRVIVCLGATAAQTILGRQFRVRQERGLWQSSSLAPRVIATFHPSSVLRAPDAESRRAATRMLIEDLSKVAACVKQPRVRSRAPAPRSTGL
jgi:uracil-DNA glycosylase